MGVRHACVLAQKDPSTRRNRYLVLCQRNIPSHSFAINSPAPARWPCEHLARSRCSHGAV